MSEIPKWVAVGAFGAAGAAATFGVMPNAGAQEVPNTDPAAALEAAQAQGQAPETAPPSTTLIVELPQNTEAPHDVIVTIPSAPVEVVAEPIAEAEPVTSAEPVTTEQAVVPIDSSTSAPTTVAAEGSDTSVPAETATEVEAEPDTSADPNQNTGSTVVETPVTEPAVDGEEVAEEGGPDTSTEVPAEEVEDKKVKKKRNRGEEPTTTAEEPDTTDPNAAEPDTTGANPGPTTTVPAQTGTTVAPNASTTTPTTVAAGELPPPDPKDCVVEGKLVATDTGFKFVGTAENCDGENVWTNINGVEVAGVNLYDEIGGQRTIDTETFMISGDDKQPVEIESTLTRAKLIDFIKGLKEKGKGFFTGVTVTKCESVDALTQGDTHDSSGNTGKGRNDDLVDAIGDNPKQNETFVRFTFGPTGTEAECNPQQVVENNPEPEEKPVQLAAFTLPATGKGNTLAPIGTLGFLAGVATVIGATRQRRMQKSVLKNNPAMLESGIKKNDLAQMAVNSAKVLKKALRRNERKAAKAGNEAVIHISEQPFYDLDPTLPRINIVPDSAEASPFDAKATQMALAA